MHFNKAWIKLFEFESSIQRSSPTGSETPFESVNDIVQYLPIFSGTCEKNCSHGDLGHQGPSKFTTRSNRSVENAKFPAAKNLGAFTLIELLVVISIIASIAGLSLASISVAMKSAKASRCANSQRQLAMGGLAYALDQEDGLPATQVYRGATRFMWYELLADYIADG